MKIEEFAMECILDGQESGMELAIDALRSTKDRIPVESQTWDGAIFMIETFLRKARESRK